MISSPPADQFYWGVLEYPTRGASRRGRAGSRAARPLAPGLLADLAADAPAPIEDLHAVAIELEATDAQPGQPAAVLVCAALRDTLAELPEGTLSFGPADIPAALGLAELKPNALDLNLLVGEFEPRPMRRARFRRLLLAASCLTACTCLVSLGLVRRAHHASEQARVTAESTARALSGVEAGATVESLERANAQLRDAITLTKQSAEPPDAVLALETMLARWNPPPDAKVTPLSLSVTGETVNATLLFEGDSAAFLSSFTAPPGWTTAEPRLTRSGQTTRVQLTVTRDRSSMPEARR